MNILPLLPHRDLLHRTTPWTVMSSLCMTSPSWRKSRNNTETGRWTNCFTTDSSWRVSGNIWPRTTLRWTSRSYIWLFVVYTFYTRTHIHTHTHKCIYICIYSYTILQHLSINTIGLSLASLLLY